MRLDERTRCNGLLSNILYAQKAFAIIIANLNIPCNALISCWKRNRFFFYKHQDFFFWHHYSQNQHHNLGLILVVIIFIDSLLIKKVSKTLPSVPEPPFICFVCSLVAEGIPEGPSREDPDVSALSLPPWIINLLILVLNTRHIGKKASSLLTEVALEVMKNHHVMHLFVFQMAIVLLPQAQRSKHQSGLYPDQRMI